MRVDLIDRLIGHYERCSDAELAWSIENCVGGKLAEWGECSWSFDTYKIAQTLEVPRLSVQALFFTPVRLDDPKICRAFVVDQLRGLKNDTRDGQADEGHEQGRSDKASEADPGTGCGEAG